MISDSLSRAQALELLNKKDMAEVKVCELIEIRYAPHDDSYVQMTFYAASHAGTRVVNRSFCC